MVMADRERRAWLLGLSAVLLWSTVATAFKLALAQMSPPELVFWASLVSALVLGGVLGWQGQLVAALRGLNRHGWRALLMGSLNPAAYYLILFEAYDRLPAQIAQPVNYTWALVLAVLAVPLLGQSLTRRMIAALMLGYLGVAVLAMGGRALGPVDLTGLGLALLSTVLWAGYWIACVRDPRPPVEGLFQNFLMAIPLLAVWVRPQWPDLPALAGALYVGCFEMGLTFVLWVSALRLTRHAARISRLIFLSPPLSLMLIAAVLGEPIQWQTWAGLALILGGVWVGRQQVAET